MCATCASGAAARNRFIAPHSSDSTWPNVIQRNRSTGITVAMADDTDGNIARGPGVEQQRLVGVDQELVEREAGRADVGHERRQAEDAVGDLVDVGFHGGSSFQSGSGLAEDAGAGEATGQDADEVDGVDVDALAADAVAELAAGRALEHELERLAVDRRPLGDDVGDEAAVVVGGQVHLAAGRLARCRCGGPTRRG